jgi:hypothetical protein
MKYQLILVLAILMMVSCQSEKEPFVYENKYANLSPEEYLTTYTTPEVMFHYMEVQQNSASVHGMLIDNKGRIYKYNSESIDIDISEVTASVGNLVMLLTHSEKLDKKIDLADLVENYKMTRKVDLRLQDKRETTSDKEFYFAGYDVTHDTEGNETCNAVGVSGDVYIQKTFKSSSSINKSSFATKIVKWMSTVLDKSDA